MKKIVFVFAAVVVFLAFLSGLSSTSVKIAAGETASAGTAIEMRYLTPSKKVIPLVWKDKKEFWTTDIKLPELLLTNRGNDLFTLKSLEIKGVCENGQSVTYRLNGDLVAAESRNINSTINRVSREGKMDALRPMLEISFGAISLPEIPLSESAVLRKGESTILLLSKVLYVHHTGSQKISSLYLTAGVTSPSGDVVKEFPLPLTPYSREGKIFVSVERQSAGWQPAAQSGPPPRHYEPGVRL